MDKQEFLALTNEEKVALFKSRYKEDEEMASCFICGNLTGMQHYCFGCGEFVCKDCFEHQRHVDKHLSIGAPSPA